MLFVTKLLRFWIADGNLVPDIVFSLPIFSFGRAFKLDRPKFVIDRQNQISIVIFSPIHPTF